MKTRVVPIKNIFAMREAADALLSRSQGMPGMGLIYGPTGYGKTTATTWLVNQVHGVYVRSMALWSPKTMLEAIARELDIDVRRLTLAGMAGSIVQRLAETGRPLFIDEADYLVDSKRLVDTLRDIHDMSTSPVVLIGMSGIDRKLRGHPQLTGRMAQWVEFSGMDAEDVRMLADGLCDVRVEDDCLDELARRATPKEGGAEIRRVVVGLGNVEQHARRKGLASVGLGDLPKGFDFFLGTPGHAITAAPARNVRTLGAAA